MGSELTVKTAIFQMRLNVLRRKRTHVKTSALGNLEISSLHGLVPTHLLQDLAWQKFTGINTGSSITDLIFVVLGLVDLTSTNKFTYNLLHLRNLASLIISKRNLIGGLLHLLFLGSKLHGYLNKTLLILTVVSITPTDVFIGGLTQVTFNVMESMLGDVSNTCVRVLPHISLLGLNLSNEKLDHRGLSSSILSNASDTRTQ
mmetsp:Transcript_25309/g.45842  ORF Transcript_25309/g.45842 Transcript_25309/m.45842 type:complete len:202 (-) Transcript_25309:262-867(-)